MLNRMQKVKIEVSIQENLVSESEIELSSIKDISKDFLSKKEINYYLNPDKKNKNQSSKNLGENSEFPRHNFKTTTFLGRKWL